ncbi:hypothetical protein ALC57_10216 [Trachymyrmex cornetzi]|uniref:Uncharacterized protein n=1 Tax=Trachymyrmex cornetzi TaxID=471704 RepID=A0A151J4E7_9HYME|nr:hypothetical protein ALC57_10216 [Trachymyrmex cornetzi]
MLTRCKNLISRNAGEYFCTFAVTRMRRERVHYVSKNDPCEILCIAFYTWMLDVRSHCIVTTVSPGLKRRIAAIFHVRTKYRFAGDCIQKYDLGTCSPPSGAEFNNPSNNPVDPATQR